MIHYRLNRYVHNLELYDKIEEISKYFNYTAQLRGLKTFHYPVNQPIISYEVSVKKPPSQNEKLYFDHEKDSKIEYFDPDKNDFRITRKYEYRKEKHYCFSKIYDVWQRIYAIIYSDSRFLLYQRI
ncbi:hypothetical protein TRFO_38186 [Tritrichomonas foetus]|uniref:Uncharacterized protein n=1 Tax=Tritrichomonas foetus TaxID=1144522 RepID=A0A1J4JAF2_9EUKA|nr:hypothetical protein TRFO_38186 [Tritrichomonas foetus]|eukprot:OHS95657.1 hypothetical protein TRFO_38186 [Tritrichomonas foetus]